MTDQKSFQTARGVRDILPKEQKFWQLFRREAEHILEGLGAERIDIPHFENIEVFSRGIGESSDIVSKEMFLLQKRSEDENDPLYALRPEATAGVVRSYIQNGMASLPQPVKLFYIGSMFRYDRPQKGRYREFSQLGMEIFGDASSKADFLAVMSAWEILRKIGLKKIIVYVNSIGCTDCRPKYIKKLKKFSKPNLAKLCTNCKTRYDVKPLRMLDCKEDGCQRILSNTPSILDSLCSDCKTHFQSVLEYLDYFKIRYDLDAKLVRGLDYYSKTVFEIAETSDKERKNSLGGGGRYDALVQLLGGANTPAVGYSLGMDRVVSALKENKVSVPEIRGVEVCILQLGDKAKEAAKKIYEKLHSNNTNVYFVPTNDGLRSQLRHAGKSGAKYAIIIGQTEALKNEVILRDLTASSQEIFSSNDIVAEIKRRFEK